MLLISSVGRSAHLCHACEGLHTSGTSTQTCINSWPTRIERWIGMFRAGAGTLHVEPGTFHAAPAWNGADWTRALEVLRSYCPSMF